MNFIDRTFSVLADILLKLFPGNKQEKQAFLYYRTGLSKQGDGDYRQALTNYFESLEHDEDPFDRSYSLYNIGLLYEGIGDYPEALEFYEQALEANSDLPQAWNNIAAIYHSLGTRMLADEYNLAGENAVTEDELEGFAEFAFDKAADCWVKAIELAPDNYPEALNWLRTTKRIDR